jgi:hypothetical protein
MCECEWSRGFAPTCRQQRERERERRKKKKMKKITEKREKKVTTLPMIFRSNAAPPQR